MSHTETRLTFFRQSGWMILANTGCGVFMAAVHPFASAMPGPEYGVFYSMLRLLTLLAIPAAGLQTVFAQQAASAIDEKSRQMLASTARAVLFAIFGLWLLICGAMLLIQNQVVQRLGLASALPLWITLLVVLAALWLPVVQGMVQGIQNFFSLGWSMISNGLGRFLAIVVIVWLLKGWAAGALVGVLIGFVLAVAVAGWHCLPILRAGSADIAWKPWLGKVIPLTLGVGATLFVMNADMVIVQSYFPKTVTPLYAAGAMLGLALVTFTTPLAAVMFPKIVRSLARAEKSNAMALALGTTALMGGLGAFVCTLFPELILRILFFTKPEFLKTAPLIPWFMWCMLPVTLANVLIGNLLARDKFAVVPWLVAIAIGYGLTQLGYVKLASELVPPLQAFRTIVQILGAYSTLLLGVAAWFTFRPEK
jgi:O-antigen/teichoic acid export membrane protein